MGKHSDYFASNASRNSQNFPEGNWQINFKALQARREAVYKRRNWNALKYPKVGNGLGYAVSIKWNTMQFLKAVFVDENLFMWKIFMRELRKQEVTTYCVT